MNEEQNQYQFKRVIGLDIHPGSFSAGAVQQRAHKDNNPPTLWVHNGIDMDNLESWLKKNTEPQDILVVEAGCNAFETIKRIKSCGRKGIILESYRAGMIGKSYLKTDKQDAIKIAKIYLSGLAHEVWNPDEKTREYREIFSSYKRSVKDCTRSRNRIWSWLTEHGVKRTTGISFIKEKGKQWILSCREWTETQKQIINLLISDVIHHHNRKQSLIKLIAREVSRNEQMLKLFRLYGINRIIAFAFMAIVGDIIRFRNPKKLVAYLGLQPKVYQSGQKSYTSSITHSGRGDLRALLVEAAHTILERAPQDHHFAKWGRSLMIRKKCNVSVIAVARKIVVAAWYLLRGFFTKLEEANDTLKTKFTKLAVQVGKEWRIVHGYLKVIDFVEDKIQFLKTGT